FHLSPHCSTAKIYQRDSPTRLACSDSNFSAGFTMNRLRRAFCLSSLFFLALAVFQPWNSSAPRSSALAAEPNATPEFKKEGVAFLQKHCVACHGGKKPKADLSLNVFSDDASVLNGRKKWQEILHQVQSG